MRIILTKELLKKGESINGQYSHEQIKLLGVDPSKKGWRKKLIDREVSEENFNKFLQLKNAHIKNKPRYKEMCEEMTQSLEHNIMQEHRDNESVNTIEIYCDGCKKGDGSGGWSYIMYNGDDTHISGGFSLDTTNNIMELTAVLTALSEFHKHHEPITVISDSKYVVDGFMGWMHSWQRRGWTKSGGPIMNLDIWKALYKLSINNNITAKWVRGHNGHKENELADTIANYCCLNRVEIGATIPRMDSILGAYELKSFHRKTLSFL